MGKVIDIKVDISGLEETLKELSKLDQELIKTVERSGYRAAITRYKNLIVIATPKGMTNNLVKGMSYSIKRYKTKIVGKILAKAPHAHLVEWGHAFPYEGKEVRRSKGKHYPSKKYPKLPEGATKVPPHSFFRPAMEKGVNIFIEDVVKHMERALKRWKKKTGM